MDQRRSPSRPKRQSKNVEEGYWDCSVCTYKNSAEAFKCEMCDVRKGTSTRKPRLNPHIVSQQVAVIPPPAPKQIRNHAKKSPLSASSSIAKKIRPRLKNIDRSSGTQMAVTVNNITVIITDYKEKSNKLSMPSSTMTSSPSSSQESTNGDNNNSSPEKMNVSEEQTNGHVNGF
ncbi:RING1 and YY1-binding protein-like [Ptychodera flava]|uniref:RING1 and YY1-binding protein-like n=1 Tax=Ptychodera flava TaxID=63121 RepID=UPI00396A4879